MTAPERRLTFGQVAELYEQVRPSYPGELVGDVLRYSHLEPGERILEVGAGTGKATRLFAAGGHEIVALEPSPEMAAVARASLQGLPSVSIVEAEFEAWALPPVPFKLLISAQAWHWIDPQVGYPKARAALERAGTLAVFWNHVDWESMPLRAAIDEAYRQAAPEFDSSGPMHPRTTRGDLVPEWEAEIAAVDGFEHPDVRTYAWRERYSSHEYARLLETHSDHVVLDPDVRERLLEAVEVAIDNHGGELEMRYVSRLCLARAA